MNEDWERHNSAENEGILVSLISKDGDCGKCLEERGRKGGKGRRAVWMNGVNHELDARMEDWIIIFIMSSLRMAVLSYSFWREAMSIVSGVKSSILLLLMQMRNTRELLVHPSSDVTENYTNVAPYYQLDVHIRLESLEGKQGMILILY